MNTRNPHHQVMKKTLGMDKTAGEVRKGAWTIDEDNLLRDCVHKYGEGKWHLVPLRAGLNRCRKSCRLRWLNYLKPNIRRGNFSREEVDLMKRMHKLLGNRWSLIAGRLPGRTANDVKNFWNTYINGKSSRPRTGIEQGTETITESSIIRPRPRSFLNTTGVPHDSHVQQKVDKKTESLPLDGLNGCRQICNKNATSSSTHEAVKNDGDIIPWWSNFLEINEMEDLGNTIVFPGQDMQIQVSKLASDPFLGFVDDLSLDGVNFWDL